MQLIVVDHYENTRQHFLGTEEDIKDQIFNEYPWLLFQFGSQCPLETLVTALNESQHSSAKLVDSLSKSYEEFRDTESQGDGLHNIRYPQGTRHGQLSTEDFDLEACRAAAAFLAGKECSDSDLRNALLETDGDNELAALMAHNLPETSLKELRAVLGASFCKSEIKDNSVRFKEVIAATESGEKFAQIVEAASKYGEIFPITLGEGKHSKGVLRAKDPETYESYLLKPGYGKQNPSLGENETGATQSQREACFYAVASAWGLDDTVPECHLLLLDGKEYACIKMLNSSYKNFNDLKAQDPNLPKRLLSLYNNGALHKWAAVDFCLGNPDRNAGNIMASGDKVKLIDHGSAFAGASFSIKDAFVPYYLRAGIKQLNKLTVTEKLRIMPRLNEENEALFKKWLLGLSKDILHQLVTKYGIDAAPEITRLERLQAATSYQTAELAVLSAWVIE